MNIFDREALEVLIRGVHRTVDAALKGENVTHQDTAAFKAALLSHALELNDDEFRRELIRAGE